MALLSQFEKKAGPLVTCGDNNKGFTIEYGKLIYGIIVIKDVALVAGLELNLLSVIQFTEKGARKESLFVADLDSTNEDGICCFYTKTTVEQSKLWIMHSKDETSHIIIEHIQKIEKQAKDLNCVKRLKSDNGT
ncbi:hypothetical protein AgCh_004693 [Apium graveolens]